MSMVDGDLLDELLGTLDGRARHAVEARFGLLDGERKSFREVGGEPRRHCRSRPPTRVIGPSPASATTPSRSFAF